MNWRTKAAIQNLTARLPSAISYRAHHWVQSHFGSLRRPLAKRAFKAAVHVAELAEAQSRFIPGSRLLEIGTGYRVTTPLALWLMGAEEIITVDLNPYVREEVVRKDVQYVRTHADELRSLLAGRLDETRWSTLVARTNASWHLNDLIDLCHIKYLAPADAAKLPLESQLIDIHYSSCVFEHVETRFLGPILQEGNRVVKRDGVFIHSIDLTDHFAGGDPSISVINFLQFSDRDWDRIAGNRYMYMNRLRADDFEELFRAANHRILSRDWRRNASVRELLEQGRLHLDARFAGKSIDVLSTVGIALVSQCSG